MICIKEENFDPEFSILKSTITYACELVAKESSDERIQRDIPKKELDQKIENILNLVVDLQKKGYTFLNLIKSICDWETIRGILLFDKKDGNKYYAKNSNELLAISRALRNRGIPSEFPSSEGDEGVSSSNDYLNRILPPHKGKMIKILKKVLNDDLEIDPVIGNNILFAFFIFSLPEQDSASTQTWSFGLKKDDSKALLACEELQKIPITLKRELMLYFTKFRKWLVDLVLNEINQNQFDDKIIFDLALGSLDPGSDYDINIATRDESAVDVTFARIADEALEALLGGPAGVVLDCNLYLKEFCPIPLRVDKELTGSPVFQRLTPYPRKYFRDILIFKDSKMAFVKVRMYSDMKGWVRFCRKMNEANPDNELLGRVLERAEKTYKNLLINFFNRLGLNFLTIENYKLEEFFIYLKECFPALFAKLCKEEYFYRFEDARRLINEYRKTRKLFQTRDFQFPDADKKMDWLAVKIRSKIMKACLFGLEMILSEGCKSFTGCEQAYNPADKEIEKNKKIRKNTISNYQLLSSINEYFGDFLKDINHYQKVDPELPGQVAYRSSKYLQRMFSCTKELFAYKINRLGVAQNLLPTINNLNIEELNTRIDQGLYQVRKSSSFRWFYASNKEKSSFSALQMKSIFGVDSINSLQECIENFLVILNSKAFMQPKNSAKLLYCFELLSFYLRFRKDIPLPFNFLQPISLKEKQTFKSMGTYMIDQEKIMSSGSYLYWYKNILGLARNCLSLISATVTLTFFPIFFLFDIIRPKFSHAKPADRYSLDIKTSIISLKDPRHSVTEIYQGEFMNYNISYSEIYKIQNNYLPIVLRIISEAIIMFLPWLIWINLMINFININFQLHLPRSLFIMLRLFSLLNFFILMIIDLVLFIMIVKSKGDIKNKSLREYSDLFLAINREFKKNRAKLLADIFGLALAFITITLNLIMNTYSNYFHSINMWIIPLVANALSLFSIKEIVIKLKGKY